MNVRMHETARVSGARWAAGVSTSFAMRSGVIQSQSAQPRPALVAISAQAPGFPRKPELTRFAMPEPALPGRMAAPLHKPRPLPARLVRVLPERCAQLPETEPLECVLFQPGPRALRPDNALPATRQELINSGLDKTAIYENWGMPWNSATAAMTCSLVA